MVSDEQAIALGRRLRASKHWQWTPGVLSLPDSIGRRWRMTWQDDLQELLPISESGPITCEPCDIPELIPDIRDPATSGCVLALLREVCSHADVYPEGSVWCWHLGEGDEDTPCVEATEAEALVAAWEAKEEV